LTVSVQASFMNEPDKKDRADRWAILTTLRQRIVTGDLRPGTVLPKRVDLEREFGASPLTIQRAVDHLRREGFVRVRPRHGTFVTENPPHLCHYAIVFQGAPGADGKWSRFYRALADQGTAVSQQPPRRVHAFYGIDTHEDNENYRLLLAMMRAQRFAGLIFTTPVTVFGNSPLVNEPGVPRVAFAYGTQPPGVSSVEFDHSSFINQALDHLAQRGRRRLAVIANPRGGEFITEIHAAAAARGMTLRPYWLQSIHLDAAEAAANCVHLLMHDGQKERPDALLIADDNLVEYSTAGLLSAGVSVPRDLDVVAHCNFPWPAPSVLPVMRLGYNIAEVLEVCINAINHQRATHKTSRHIIPPQFGA
jgi:hypothetical protein